MSDEREERYQGNSYRNRTKQAEQQKKKEDPKPVAKGKLQKPTIKERLTDSFIAATGDDIKERVIAEQILLRQQMALISMVGVALLRLILGMVLVAK